MFCLIVAVLLVATCNLCMLYMMLQRRQEAQSGPQTGENFQRASSVNLLRSPTDPDDVARAVVFLAENASITGTTLTVDKGQHLVPLARDIMFVAEQLAPPQP